MHYLLQHCIVCIKNICPPLHIVLPVFLLLYLGLAAPLCPCARARSTCFRLTSITHDIQVQVDKDRKLIVSGERKQEEMDVNWRQQKQERRFGAFQRKFQLPEDADVSKIQGKAENGVLTITISKIPKEDVPSDSTSIPIY